MRLIDRLLEDPDDVELVVRRFRRAAIGAWLGFPAAMVAMLGLIAAGFYDSGVLLPILGAGIVFSFIQALQALDLKQAWHRLRLRQELQQADVLTHATPSTTE